MTEMSDLAIEEKLYYKSNCVCLHWVKYVCKWVQRNCVCVCTHSPSVCEHEECVHMLEFEVWVFGFQATMFCS